MPKNIKDQYNENLSCISDALDISPSKYQQAVERYTSVGNWLKTGVYKGCSVEPLIYPQGSFRLGTVVRPLADKKEADYDIDLVCELQIDKTSTTPGAVKTMIGARLKENDIYRKMLDDEGRRCWTLQYTEQDSVGFHLDILPSVPEEKNIILGLNNSGISMDLADKAIAITDGNTNRTVYGWSPSNPEGYARWFDQRKSLMFEHIVFAEKRKIFESNSKVFNKISAVPDALVKTPLQRAIQILKRHRDMFFSDRDWNTKPISMIITTISAILYNNESDVYSTLKNIIEKLDAHAGLVSTGYTLNENLAPLRLIWRDEQGIWHISNPVNPMENFADKWHEDDNQKARAFFMWVSQVRKDLIDILNIADSSQIVRALSRSIGESIVRKAMPQDFVTGPTIISGATGSAHHPPTVEIKNPSKPWGKIN